MEFLQPADLERGAPAERQHVDQRGDVRPVLRGDAAGRRRVGVREPVLRAGGGIAQDTVQ